MLQNKTYDSPDYILLGVTIALSCIGIIFIYGSSALLSERLYNVGYMFFIKQIFGISIGLVLMRLLYNIDVYTIRKYSVFLLFLGIIMLILVFVPGIGKKSNGARRWINLVFFTIQPAEFTKLFLIIYMADVLARKQKILNDFVNGILPIMLILVSILCLIKFQPDMGTMIITLLIALIMMLGAGLSLLYVVPFLSIGSIATFIIVRADPIRWKRLTDYISFIFDPNGGSYHLIQSCRALKSGGILGVGLGNSLRKFFYLPEAHNDFIFAIIGEELGWLGTSFVVILFIILIWRGTKIIYKTYDVYQGLIAIGIVSMLGLEAAINIGVVLGLLPTKGTPLPLISYGVSSVIVNLAAVGLLLNISKNTE